ncbi:hypothetical protein [Tardiphaga robiniae]|uniref:hypothetical protein n=1 Tax=Tardiphaga robiniae TaxID=943830 RepID=UPI00158676FE|nr:hypothetical protein [Tardiphaga robiniae]NUU41401.1 hypothetical protein [Tardiphaga robiniae]
MSALDHSHLLTRLIMTGEAVLQMRHSSDHEIIIDLAAAIEAEARRPADIERVIDAGTVMCAQAVMQADKLLQSVDRHKAVRFIRVVGVLLPEVRDALGLAIEQRRRPTA